MLKPLSLPCLLILAAIAASSAAAETPGAARLGGPRLPTGSRGSGAITVQVVANLKDVIIDPDGTGRRALLLPRWLKYYPGAFPGPIFYDIYDYTAGRLIRADLRHPAYYHNVLLPRLAKEMAAISTPAYDGPPSWRVAAMAADTLCR
jgi:hypothetical protein